MKPTKRTIHVVGGDTQYANWMEGTGYTDNVNLADLIVFTGGADVSPHMYNKQKHPTTHCNEARDREELAIYKHALQLCIPMIGICRGAQFGCVMAGGELIQDQDDNSYFHDIITYDGKSIPMTSLHHQAAYPWRLPTDEYNVLAWTHYNSSHHDLEKPGAEAVVDASPCLHREVEIIHFPFTNFLGIQGHPEMMYHRQAYSGPIKDSIAYCRNLLNQHMNYMLP